MLADRGGGEGPARLVGYSAVVFGAALAVFALSGRMGLSLAAMVVAGWGLFTTFIDSNITLQSLTSDRMRGRVMALYSMTFLGISPIGNLLAGALSEKFGAPATLAVGGALCALSGLWFLKAVAQRMSPAAETA